MDCPYGEKMCGDTYGCYCQRCWDERTKTVEMQTCGFCGGSGKIETNPYDNYGYDRGPDYPTHRPCEYCDGAGECEKGDTLLPAAKPRSNPRG